MALTKEPEYIKYVNEIVKDFINEMKKEYGLICVGDGGQMPDHVRKIDVLFHAYKNAKIDEVRPMQVSAVSRLLDKINNHEKIRAFLHEYPFKSDRVCVSISFRTETDDRPKNEFIALTYLAKGKIFYKIAEKRVEMSFPASDCRDPNNIIYYPAKEEIVEELVTIHEEPFEEALKIVNENK